MPQISKNLLNIYITLDGLNHMVQEIFNIAFTIILFKTDHRGVAGSYLLPASLLGTILAGFGGPLLKQGGCYTISICAPLLKSLTLLSVYAYNAITTPLCIITFLTLFCISNVESANNFGLINPHIPNDKKPFFIATLQITNLCFKLFASITTAYLLKTLGLKVLITGCIGIYILRIILWRSLKRRGLCIQPILQHQYGLITGYQELIHNTKLLHITIFRTMMHIAITTYFTSLPIITAKIANKNSHIYEQLYSNCHKFLNIGYLISNITGLWLFKKKFIFMIPFSTISAIILMLSAIISHAIINPYCLQTASFLEGLALFLFSSSNMIMGQTCVSQAKLPHAILAGDSIVKTCSYFWGCSIPKLLLFYPIQRISMPLTALVIVCFCIAIQSLKSLNDSYLK